MPEIEDEDLDRPASFHLVTSLKACANNKDLKQGSKLHAAVCRLGLIESNVYVRSALISMYSKCGALVSAQQVLDKLPFKEVECWNALIAGYVQHMQGHQAIGCFQAMSSKGISPNATTYACTLKACSIMSNIDMGERIYNEIICKGLLTKSVVVGNALVDMYAKCCTLAGAQKVLDSLSIRNVVSWSALISGYVQQGQGHEALGCFQCMCREGLSPDAILYALILKACAIIQDVDKGSQIHDEIVSRGVHMKNLMVGSALIHMYAKCGILAKAKEVFDELPIRDVVVWTAMIAGHAQQGQGKEALCCFQQMRKEGLSPNSVTYVSTLKACGITRDFEMGKAIHDEIDSKGILKTDSLLGNALVDMYANCGEVIEAQRVFDELCVRDLVTWNAMIAGYAQFGLGQKALCCFQRMCEEGMLSDAMTYAFVLKGCSGLKDANNGKKIHSEIIHQELLRINISIGNALVDMYAKCGMVEKAQNVLDELPVRSVVCWSALIAGYAQQEQGQKALWCLQQMHDDGLTPDAITYVCALKACGTAQDIYMGKRIHEEVFSQGLLNGNLILGNALVDMYAKCGDVVTAEKLVDELQIQNVISWSSVMTGYARQGWSQEALDCFQRMRREGFCPDVVAYICILKVCSIAQDIDMGEKVHKEIVSQGLLQINGELCNAVVGMYSKCGVYYKAQKVLDEHPTWDVVSWNAMLVGYAEQGKIQEASCFFHWMSNEGLHPDLVSWNTLIGGYAQQGLGYEALNLLNQMQEEDITPDAITLSTVLNACSHSGLVDEGVVYFNSMKEKYYITPDKEHYTCMVDLFGRAGLCNKAMRIVQMMPLGDHPTVWFSLSVACQKWGNIELGRLAFDHTIQLNAYYSAAYVVLSDIYAAASLQVVQNH